MLIFTLMTIVPLFLTLVYSVFDYDGITIKSFLGMSNYISLFGDENFRIANINIFARVLANLLLQLPVAFLLALILSNGMKGETFFRNVYFIPVVISSIVVGTLWINVFKSDYGLLNTLIRRFIPDFKFSWLTDPRTATMTTIVPSLWQYVGYHMLLFYAGLKSLSKDYYEAAIIDGANFFQTTTRITIPLLASTIKICVIFCLVGSITTFDYVYIMTRGGPNNISHSPATLMYKNLFERGLYGYGSAQAVILVIQCIIVSIIVQRLFKRAEDNV